MPPDTGGMFAAKFRFLILAISLVLFAGGQQSAGELAGDRSTWTADQHTLVDFALTRFAEQGLTLPDVTIVFHDSLLPCDGHKGLYWHDSLTLEMCSLDKATMLHELAHAWANTNLSSRDMEEFVGWRHLDSWNDQEDPWKRRGTEHVAETIAWALMDQSQLVRWVEPHEDGSQWVSHRLLTIEVDAEQLVENFRFLVGRDPIFRNTAEWSDADQPEIFSPELARTDS